MTDLLLRRAHHAVAPLQQREVDAAIEFVDADPVLGVVVRMHLDRARARGGTGGLWAVRRRSTRTPALTGDDLEGVIFAGANLWPLLRDGDSALVADVARTVRTRVRRPAAIVGRRASVAALWSSLERAWAPARLVRDRQLSMALDGPARASEPREGAPALEPVRLADARDYDDLLPACAHMFRSEVGYDPLAFGRAAYEARLKSLIASRWSYVQYGEVAGERRIVFKAEVGALGGEVAQIQGVWVHPSARGHGIARASLPHVAAMVQRDLAPTVSLYVNDFNAAAVSTYRAMGMREVGELQTVMF